MNIDLERELARVAGSVGDDVVAERMSGQVRTMVGRIRRRRAARHTAQGAVGIGAAAAVAFGGVQLADRPQAPPAGPSQDPTDPVEADAFGECGTTVVDPNPGADPVVGLEGGDVAVEGGSTALLSVSPTILDGADVTLGDVRLVAARDGVVVGPVSDPTSVAESFPPVYAFEQPLESCDDGAPLAPGEYELYALQDVTLPGSSVTEVLGGPWTFTLPADDGGTGEEPVSPDEPTAPDAELSAEQEQARTQIEAWIASPVANPEGVMPRCGAQAVLDDGTTPLVLDPPFADGAVDLSDERFQSTITMRTRDGQYVIGNAAGSGATLVLMQQGVVVGYQWLDSEELTLVDLQPDQTLEIPLRGSRFLCGTGEGGTGPELPLPPGTYQAVAVVDVMLKEVGVPGGEARSVTQTVPVMSEPTEVEITG